MTNSCLMTWPWFCGWVGLEQRMLIRIFWSFEFALFWHAPPRTVRTYFTDTCARVEPTPAPRGVFNVPVRTYRVLVHTTVRTVRASSVASFGDTTCKFNGPSMCTGSQHLTPLYCTTVVRVKGIRYRYSFTVSDTSSAYSVC